MPEHNEFLGIVVNGQFHRVSPERPIGSPLRLTEIQRQEAILPEAKEIHLKEYEGKAIMIQGIVDSGWVYTAQVIDHGGPILTALVKKVFQQKSEAIQLE